MNSIRSSHFRKSFAALPVEVQKQANKAYRLWKCDPFHPSLHFKPTGKLWSVRIGKQYCALGVRDRDTIKGLWIGAHTVYEQRL